MSYRFTVRADGSGEYVDNRSNQSYTWTKDKTGQSKASAKQAMLQDQSQIRKASEARPKPATPTMRGVQVSPELARLTKPRSERAAEVQHIGRQPGLETTIANQKERYERELASAKDNGDRQKALRRLASLDVAESRAVVNKERREARKARVENPALADTIKRAEQIHFELLQNESADESFVTQARQNVIELKRSLDVADYEAREKALRDRFDFDRNAKVASMQATLAVQKQEIKSFQKQPGIEPGLEPEGGADVSN